jgi:cytochrome c peroxidase
MAHQPHDYFVGTAPTQGRTRRREVFWSRTKGAAFALVGLGLVVTTGSALRAQDVFGIDPNGQISAPIRSLTGLQPLLPDVSDYIQDADAAQQLGKALFWDTQVGSDGTACASCHFHAGADIRVTNQVNPGLKAGDPFFGVRATGATKGPNQEFSSHDFPFRKLQDASDRDSPLLFDTNDVFSSQGTFGGEFVSSTSNGRRQHRGERHGHRGHGDHGDRGHDRGGRGGHDGFGGGGLGQGEFAVGGVGQFGFAHSLIAALLASLNEVRGLSDRGSEHGSNTFGGRRPGLANSENCSVTYAPLDPLDPTIGSPFHADGQIYRKVEPRNTPTTINAVFNLRQFWDGRANNQFNGIDPFGRRTYIQEMVDPIDPNFKLGNPNANTTGIIVALGSPALRSAIRLDLRQPLIENASLASQAVGPPLSNFEMSCSGKTFKDLGRKLIPYKALATQAVDPNDSLFSKTRDLMNRPGVPGLSANYGQLIKKAFKSKYWSAPNRYVIDPVSRQPVVKFVGGYTQMEHNFSLFWGLAIQAYEQLLISNDTPFDRYKDGNTNAMSPAAVRGMGLFNSKGNCFECHSGALLSAAAVTNDFFLSPQPVEGMLMRDGNRAMYDGGYYNIGLRPAFEDVGNGGIDPYGFDLSHTRQYRWQFLPGGAASSVDLFDVNRCTYPEQHLTTGCLIVPDPQRDAVDGAFKAPILRNVALTPPYFHNGGTSNLKDVVRFYNRGGDRRQVATGGDTSGHPNMTPLEEINLTNLAPGIGEPIGSARKGLGLTEHEMDDLVEFMLALTDDRVACHSDVFDHPELPLPLGQKSPRLRNSLVRLPQPFATAPSAVAQDVVVTLPATGKLGLRAVAGECFPNSGDLFGTLNKADHRGLQRTFRNILYSRQQRGASRSINSDLLANSFAVVLAVAPTPLFQILKIGTAVRVD